jgi:hypothetical protein
MTFIPPALWKRFRDNAQKRNVNKLDDILLLRAFLQKNEDDCTAEILREAADAMIVDDQTVRRVLWQIGSIPDDFLKYTISSGFSFQHLEKANQLFEAAKYESPLALLVSALDKGGESGAPMTVREFVQFAIGDADERPSPSVRFTQLLDRVVAFAQTLGWGKEKRERFEAEIKSLVERYM